MDTTTRIVVIDGYFSVFVPNSFTPDDDGVNDLFLPAVKDQDPQTHHFAVYDRWGERIFETSDATHPWDGTVGGSKAKEDVYVWQVESTSVVDGKRRMFLVHPEIACLPIAETRGKMHGLIGSRRKLRHGEEFLEKEGE